ncbi:hypothetical protein BKA69DRAFT_1083447 [Paraphysoderma sedebokerense]|nr:hypothetical protein BKA69DRAFT_1083447 [Paraphysoderma sedebokerense]
MQRFKKVSLSDIISDHVTIYVPDPTTTATNQPIVLLIGTISVASSPTQTILVNYPIPTGSIIFTDTNNVSILIEWPLFDSSLLNLPVLLHTFAFVPTTTREPSFKALPYLEIHATPIPIPNDHILLKLWPTFSCREFDAFKFIQSSTDLHVQSRLTETTNSYRLTQIEQLSSTKRKLTSIEAILYAKSPLHLHKTPQFLLELVEFNKSGVMLNAFVIVTGTQFLESYYNLRPAHRILITNLKASKISKDGTTRKVWMSTDSTRFHNMETGNQTEDVVDCQQSHSQTSIGEYMEHAQSQSQITSTGDRQLTSPHEVSPAQTPLSQSQSQSSQSAKPPPVITYSGTISAILDPSCGLYELDNSHLLTLIYYPAPLESYRQYRVGTTVQLHHVFVTQIRDSLIGGDLAQSKKKRAREEDEKPLSAQNDGSKHDLNTRLCFVASYYSHIRVISFSQATKSESSGAAYMLSAIPRDILSLFDYYTSLYLSHLVRQFTTKFPSTPGIQQHHHMLSFYIRLLTRLYGLPHPPKKMDRQLLDEFVDHPRSQILESPFRQNVYPVNIAEIKTVLSLLDRYISHHILPSVVETRPPRFELNSCVHVIQTSLLDVEEPLLLCGLFRGSQIDGKLTLRDQVGLPVILASEVSDGDAAKKEKWMLRG